jgi:hypothetical protein
VERSGGSSGHRRIAGNFSRYRALKPLTKSLKNYQVPTPTLLIRLGHWLGLLSFRFKLREGFFARLMFAAELAKCFTLFARMEQPFPNKYHNSLNSAD